MHIDATLTDSLVYKAGIKKQATLQGHDIRQKERVMFVLTAGTIMEIDSGPRFNISRERPDRKQ